MVSPYSQQSLLKQAGYDQLILQFATLENHSRRFLEADGASEFPQILESAAFICEFTQFGFGFHLRRFPRHVKELRQMMYYVPSPRILPRLGAKPAPLARAPNVRLPLAAMLHLFPSTGFAEGLRLLWGLMVKVSIGSRILRILGEMGEELPGVIVDALRSVATDPVPDPLPIPSELAQYLEPSLNLLDAYWDRPGSPLHNRTIFMEPQSVQTLTPRVVCQAPNEQLVVEFNRSVSQEGATPETFFQKILSKDLVLSGGLWSPIEFVQDPQSINTPTASDVYHFVVRPTSPFDGRQVHCGPVNFIERDVDSAVEEFLAWVRKDLRVTSNRFWLPYDPEELNLLWVGKPSVSFNVPEWMTEDPSCKSVPLTLWGAEHLNVWMDGAICVDLDRAVQSNHERDTVYLPRNMQLKQMEYVFPLTTYLWPRHYDVRILVTNRCGRTDKTWTTGVTYPAHLHFLGAEVGQTISQGSISPYEQLRFQPAYGSFSKAGAPYVTPITPPIVRGRPMLIRIFLEHDAPPPHFSPADPPKPLPLEWEFHISRGGDAQPTDYRWEGFYGYVTYNTIVSPAGIDSKKYHTMRSGTASLWILFTPPTTGRYYLQGTVDFSQAIKAECGFKNAPVGISLDFYVDEPSKVCLHLVRVEPGDETTGKPVTNDELLFLAAWLPVLIPSVDLQYYIGESITIKHPGKGSDVILSKLEHLQDGWDGGIWIAIIDEELWGYCDSSVTDWWGYTEPLGGRRAWVKLERNDLMTTAKRVAHEFGHAHPRAFKHIHGCEAGPIYNSVGDYISGHGYDAVNFYWRPDMSSFYPYGSCGENLFIPIVLGTSLGPNWLFYLVQSPDNNRDIMTYCLDKAGFELYKTTELLGPFDELG